MNPISISPSDLMLLLFGSHDKRHQHLDLANHHWLRRPGAPTMDLPSKIVLPHIAAEIQAADPDGVYIHIQTVSPTIDFTYHVLWLKHHWLESEEKKRVRYFTSLNDRAALTARNAHSERMATMIGRLQLYLPPGYAENIIVTKWSESASEDIFREKISHLETLLNNITIYEPPVKEEETQSESPASEDREHREAQ